MPQELVQLVVEVDASKVGPVSARMRQDFSANVRAMDAESKRAQLGVVGIGTAATTAGKFAATGMRVASAAIGAATAAAAAQQRSWLTLGATILGSFAVGGPIGGAIAVLAAGVGLIVAEQEKAAESARKWADEVQRVNDGIRDSIREDRDAIRDRLAELVKLDSSALRAATEEYERAVRDLRRLEGVEDAAGVRLGDIASISDIDSTSGEQAANLRLLYDQIQGLRALLPKLDAEVRREATSEALRLTEERGQTLGQIAAIRADLEGRAANEVAIEQRILQLERERAIVGRDTTGRGQDQAAALDRQLESQRELLDVTIRTNRARADRDLGRELEMLRAVTDADRERLTIERQIEERRRAGASEGLLAEYRTLLDRQPVVDFARSLTTTLRDSLSDAVVDGLRNGFRDGADIAEALFEQLLRQTTGSLVASVTSTLPSLLVGLFGGGGGGLGGAASTVTSVVGALTGGGTSAVSGAGFSPLPDILGGT